MNRLFNYLFDARAREMKLLELYGPYLTDKKYLQRMYRLQVGRKLNLDNPKTYTEKLQWLKLYDRKPYYNLMQDKYTVREYVSEHIGEQYLIPLLGVWDQVDDINFETLPSQFVLKCNHDCASVIICRDKKRLDIEKAKDKLRKCLATDYYLGGREWAYKDIKRKIIAEEYIEEKGNKTLTDYKFFCFSGKVKMVLLASGEAHTKDRRLDYFDREFAPLPIKRGDVESSSKTYFKPDGFDNLISLAEAIAGDIPFIRVDFYLIEGKPYFGEVAFYPGAGFAEFSPHEWEERIGSWIILPEKNTM